MSDLRTISDPERMETFGLDPSMPTDVARWVYENKDIHILDGLQIVVDEAAKREGSLAEVLAPMSEDVVLYAHEGWILRDKPMPSYGLTDTEMGKAVSTYLFIKAVEDESN